MRNIVLTFDDCYDVHLTYVKPFLERLGFTATFFVSGHYLNLCNKFNKSHLKSFEDNGFELGNHLNTHYDMTQFSSQRNEGELYFINEMLEDLGVSKPISFAYPGFHVNENVIKTLKNMNFKYARSGLGNPFNPKEHDPLDIASTGVFGRDYKFNHFLQDLNKVKDGDYGIFCIHNIVGNLSESTHETDTTFDVFERCIMHLFNENYKIRRLKDIELGQ